MPLTSRSGDFPSRLTAEHAGLLALVVLLSGIGTGQVLAQTNGVDYEARGDSLHAAFQNEQALRSYKSALGNGVKTYDLLMSLARAANDTALDAEAIEDDEKAQAMFDEAVGYAEELSKAYPDSAGSWFILAATTGKLAQFRGGKEKVRIGRAVEKYYKTSIALDSTFALAYLVGGIFNREVAQLNWVQRLLAKTLFGGLPDASLEVSRSLLKKAIQLQDDLLTAHWELAQTCFAMDRRDEALAHVRYISRLTPLSSDEVRLKKQALALLERENQ